MVSRFLELDRKSFLVQFIAVEPITFYATADGTDLIQDVLRKQLAREDSEILGQEGSLSIDDNGEFLSFEPTDTKNRTLHLPIEHLAYSGALRRMKEDKNDTRNPDQIRKRQFENVDLANRYPQDIIGPPIFIGIFHGFDNALCYTFITQSADDACLLVMKLMRIFRQREQQQIEQQGQINQGSSSHLPVNNSNTGPPLSVSHTFENPSYQSFPPNFIQTQNMYQQDDLIQNLLSNPNVQIINQPSSIYPQQIDNNIRVFTSLPSSNICYPQPTNVIVRTVDNCCPPSYTVIPQETLCCEPTVCTQCCLPVSSSVCVVEDDPCSSSYCYSL